jgi:hypothetical protein
MPHRARKPRVGGPRAAPEPLLGRRPRAFIFPIRLDGVGGEHPPHRRFDCFGVHAHRNAGPHHTADAAARDRVCSVTGGFEGAEHAHVGISTGPASPEREPETGAGEVTAGLGGRAGLPQAMESGGALPEAAPQGPLQPGRGQEARAVDLIEETVQGRVIGVEQGQDVGGLRCVEEAHHRGAAAAVPDEERASVTGTGGGDDLRSLGCRLGGEDRGGGVGARAVGLVIGAFQPLP